MRILIINSEYPPVGGGAGNASAQLAVGFIAKGQDVTVLTTQYNNLPKNTLQDGVRVQRIKAIRRRQDRSGAFEQAIFLLSGCLHTIFLVRNWRPDVIVSFFGVPCGAVSWITKALTSIPYLVSLRGGDVPGFRPYDFAFYHRLIGPILHSIWRQADVVVANSQGLRQLAVDFDRQVDIKVIPNGVDLNRFSPPEKRDWGPPKMLFVGRLVYQKGLDVLFRALSELKQLPWQLNLVGDGPDRIELERLAERSGLAERIEFKGWIDKKVIIEEFWDANLFVFPSRHEGMPNAVLEAMACGLPVIASDIAGNEELVIHGKTGLLVPPENPTEWQNVLNKLLPDSRLRMKMGMESRKRVENFYTWERATSQYLVLLQRIIG